MPPNWFTQHFGTIRGVWNGLILGLMIGFGVGWWLGVKWHSDPLLGSLASTMIMPGLCFLGLLPEMVWQIVLGVRRYRAVANRR
jgi:hypothetical protein